MCVVSPVAALVSFFHINNLAAVLRQPGPLFSKKRSNRGHVLKGFICSTHVSLCLRVRVGVSVCVSVSVYV